MAEETLKKEITLFNLIAAIGEQIFYVNVNFLNIPLVIKNNQTSEPTSSK